MRALGADSATGEIAREYQLSPKLLERWRAECRAEENSPFPALDRGALACGRSTITGGLPSFPPGTSEHIDGKDPGRAGHLAEARLMKSTEIRSVCD